MILDKNSSPAELKSEGKLLEIIPVIVDGYGVPWALPPVVFECPNWLLGFRDDHPIGMPINLFQPSRINIPGTSTTAVCRLEFMVRILESSPSANVQTAMVTADAVEGLLAAIRAVMGKE